MKKIWREKMQTVIEPPEIRAQKPENTKAETLSDKSEKRRKLNRFISFPVVLTFVILFLLAKIISCKHQEAPSPKGPEVAVVTVQPERVVVTTELPGRTSPFRIAEIRPQVSGLIQKRLFTEGAEVKEGEVLYQIDPAPFEAAYDRAKAHIPALKLRADRYQEALEDKAVSQQDFDDADAALDLAEAELRTAQINLEYTRVVSPINGRIGTSTVTEGAIVTAYQPMALATIQQLDPIYVDVPQSANELLRLKRSMKQGSLNYEETYQNDVKLILADGTPYPLEGTLQFKDVTVDPTTGSVILRAVFPNPENILLPGMFVRAIITEGAEEAILVPQQGIARNPRGDPYALIVSAEEKVETRALTLDRAVGDKWLALSGLGPGDRVIVEGVQKVRPGAFVSAVPFNPAGPADAKTAQLPAKKN